MGVICCGQGLTETYSVHGGSKRKQYPHCQWAGDNNLEEKRLTETLWEEQKMLGASMFSFSNNVYNNLDL